MTTIAIYAGRFQPFSLNHLEVWKSIMSSPLFDTSFIATSHKIDMKPDDNCIPKSPFTFLEIRDP